MNVRCTRCRAVYSLEDVLFGGGADFKPLPPSIQVECGRCAYLFEAPVPGKGARSSNPKVTPVPRPEAPRHPSNDKIARILKPRRPGDAEGGAVEHHVRAPVLQRGAADERASEFERAERLRQKRTRLGLGAAGAVALIIALILVAPALKKKLTGGLPAEAKSKVEKARARVLLDDQVSLGEAVRLFHEAARLAPGEAQPEADFAYAAVLLSEAHREQAERLEASERTDTDRLAKLQADKPEAWEQKSASLANHIARAAADREPHRQEAQRLIREAHAAANAALEEEPDELSVQRAQALYWAVVDAEKGVHFLDLARLKAPRDPLTLYVRAAAALAGARSREKDDKALSALAEVQQADPRFLRALYDSAAISAERQQVGAARHALQQLLRANPQHERAQALLASLPSMP